MVNVSLNVLGVFVCENRAKTMKLLESTREIEWGGSKGARMAEGDRRRTTKMILESQRSTGDKREDHKREERIFQS